MLILDLGGVSEIENPIVHWDPVAVYCFAGTLDPRRRYNIITGALLLSMTAGTYVCALSGI